TTRDGRRKRTLRRTAGDDDSPPGADEGLDEIPMPIPRAGAGGNRRSGMHDDVLPVSRSRPVPLDSEPPVVLRRQRVAEPRDEGEGPLDFVNVVGDVVPDVEQRAGVLVADGRNGLDACPPGGERV